MKDNQMTLLEHRATWGLGTLFSLRMLGMFMLLPVIPTYGMALSGANQLLIGVAIGIYGLTQAILQIPFGLLSDRLGRKPVIVTGLLIFMAGSIIAALSESIWGIIIGRAVQGAGAISAAVMALLCDLTREQNRTKAMAFVGISFGITFAAAMILGPYLAHHFGLHALFWVTALLASLGIIIILTIVPSAASMSLNRDTGVIARDLYNVLRNKQLLKLNVSIMCLHALLMLSFVALPQAMLNTGFLLEQHAQLYLLTLCISFLIAAPIIIYAEIKRRLKRVMMLGIALLFFTEILLSTTGKYSWGIIAGLEIFFIAFNVLEAILPAVISKEAPAAYKGSAMGIYATSQFIGTSIGGVIGGWLCGIGGVNAAFIAGACIALIWFYIAFTLQEPAYVSSLRISLPVSSTLKDSELAMLLKAQPGVTAVVIIAKERNAYIKVDTKKSSRNKLEQLINAN